MQNCCAQVPWCRRAQCTWMMVRPCAHCFAIGEQRTIQKFKYNMRIGNYGESRTCRETRERVPEKRRSWRCETHSGKNDAMYITTTRCTIKFMIIIIVLRSHSRSVRAYFPQHNNLLHSFGCHCLCRLPSVRARSMHEFNKAIRVRLTAKCLCVCVCAVRSHQFLFVYCLASCSLLCHVYFSGSLSDLPAYAWRNKSPPSIGARVLHRRKRRRKNTKFCAWFGMAYIYVRFNCIHRRNRNNKGKHYPNEYLFERSTRCDAVPSSAQLLIQ